MRCESPTSLKVFHQCARKYHAQYITKELPWMQSEAAARGDRLHKLMEEAINRGWEDVSWYQTEEPSNVYNTAYNFYEAIIKLKDSGWNIQTELETATDGLGNSTEWWGKDSWLRSKIDVCATHPNKDFAIVIDWKTGKIYDEDRIQLDVNAITLKPITGFNNYKVMFAYLDQNIIKNYDVTVDLDKPREFDLLHNAGTKLMDIMVVIHTLKDYTARNFWPCTKNKFCNWCKVKDCKRR